MARLQRKCVIASIGIHALLFLVLVICPGFFLPRSQAARDNGTGNVGTFVFQLVPIPATLESAQPLVPVAKPSVPQILTEQSIEEISPSRPDHYALWSDHRSPKPHISTNLVARSPGSVASTQKQPGNISREQFSRAVEGIFQGLSSATTVNLDVGAETGAGNQSYAQIVRAVYTRTWDPAGAGVTREANAVVAKVVIGRDGKVVSARTTKSSGNMLMDQSVQAALDLVKLIEPFEPGAKETERTYTISFDLRAR